MAFRDERQQGNTTRGQPRDAGRFARGASAVFRSLHQRFVKRAGHTLMSIKGKAYIMGAYEHPTRKAPDKSVPQIHAESALGAVKDAGLSLKDVDGYFCAGDAPGLGPLSMIDYMGLKVKHVDSTDVGGSSYILHVAHAAEAIAAGKCTVALITLAGKPLTSPVPRAVIPTAPDASYESPYGIVV